MGAGAPRVWCERGHIKRHPANNVWGTFWRSLANCIHTSIYRVYCIKRARGGRAIGCPRRSIPPHTQCYMVRLNMCGARAICRWVSAHAESAKRELGIGASNNGYIIYTLYCVICMVLVYMFVRSRAWSCFIFFFNVVPPGTKLRDPFRLVKRAIVARRPRPCLHPSSSGHIVLFWTGCGGSDTLNHAESVCARSRWFMFVYDWMPGTVA